MVGKNVAYLREHGPSTLEPMPNGSISVKDKQNGVWKCNPMRHDRVHGPPDANAVYYLKGEHDTTAVVEAFAAAHSGLEIRGENVIRQLITDIEGRSSHDSMQSVVSLVTDHDNVVLRDPPGGNNGPDGRAKRHECPGCGQQIGATRFPQHYVVCQQRQFPAEKAVNESE